MSCRSIIVNVFMKVKVKEIGEGDRKQNKRKSTSSSNPIKAYSNHTLTQGEEKVIVPDSLSLLQFTLL